MYIYIGAIKWTSKHMCKTKHISYSTYKAGLQVISYPVESRSTGFCTPI